MSAYLGHVQRAIITRLAGQDRTTADLADVASGSVIGNSLGVLAERGLIHVTGSVPAAGDRGGRPRDVWGLTRAGRRAHAALEAEAAR